MKLTNKNYNPDTNEYSFEIKLQDRVVNMWITLENMNKLSEFDIIDMSKSVFNQTIDLPPDGITGETLIQLDNKFIHTFWCVDETDSLNIDQINVINEKVFNQMVASQKYFLEHKNN